MLVASTKSRISKLVLIRKKYFYHFFSILSFDTLLSLYLPENIESFFLLYLLYLKLFLISYHSGEVSHLQEMLKAWPMGNWMLGYSVSLVKQRGSLRSHSKSGDESEETNKYKMVTHLH